MDQQSRLLSHLSIQEAAHILKVSEKTLRRWEDKQILIPIRTAGGHRRYTLDQLHAFKASKKKIKELHAQEAVFIPAPISAPVSAPADTAVFTQEIQAIAPVRTPARRPSITITPAFRLRARRTFQGVAFAGAFVMLAIGVRLIARPAAALVAQVKLPTIVVPTFKLPTIAIPTLNVPSIAWKRPSHAVSTKAIASNVLGIADEYIQFSLNVDTVLNQNLRVVKDASVGGTLSIDSGTVATSADTVSLFDTNATSLTFGASGTSIAIGGSTGTTTINSTTTAIRGTLNLIGNRLTSQADLLIDPGGGGVRIGTGTPVSVDSASGDLFVSDGFEVKGAAYLPTIITNGDTITDFTGTGLQVSSGVLSTSLGTSIATSEIDDEAITEPKLNLTNDASDGYLLSSAGDGKFTWVPQSSVVNFFTDNGANISITDTTDDLSLGTTTNLAKLGIAGDSDEIQLLARGNSTQTSNIFAVQNSSGTNLFTVSNAGTLTVSALNCTSYANGGALTADSSGVITCGDDDGGGVASPFTTTAGVANLINPANDTTIGSSTDYGKLAVVGDSDEFQFLVHGNATQTSFLGVFEQSTGTDVFTIANSGDLVTAGNLAVNGGNLTTTSTTAYVFNSTATTLNIGGAATTLNLGMAGGTMTIPSNVTITGTLTTAASDFAADGSVNLTPSGTNDITFTLDADSTFTLNGVQSGSASVGLCLDGSNNLISCSTSASVTLQSAYGNDGDGSDTVIALTSADDSVVIRNPAASGSDSGYAFWVDQLNTGNVDGVRVSNAGTGDSIQIDNASTGPFIRMDASSIGTTAAGVIISNSDTGVITSAIDVSDTEIVNAISIGSNNLLTDSGAITSTEIFRLAGKDAALVDTNDAVATAITGTGALNAGSITSGFGSIDVGTDAISTSGTVTAGTLSINAEAFTDLTGNGLQISAGSLTLKLQTATDALSSTISSGSGLETFTGGLALLQGCSDGQVLKWSEGADTWGCANDSGAASAIINVQNNGTPVGSNVDTLNFTTGLKVIENPSGTDNVSFDFSSSLSGDHTLAAGEAIFGTSGMIFEGSAADTIETYISVTNPTSTDKTITIPDRTGTISLSGDTFTGDVTGTLNASGATALTIASDSVALGTDTTGNYVASLTAGNGVTGTVASEGATPTIDVGAGNGITVAADSVAVDQTFAFTLSNTSNAFTGTIGQSTPLAGAFTNFSSNGTFASTLTTTNSALFSSSTANSDSIAIKPQSATATNSFTGTLTSSDLTAARTYTLPDRTGTFSLSGDTFSGDVTGTLNATGDTALTIAADSVALGTDTTGNYVQSVTNGTGITGGNGGSEGAALTLAVDQSTAFAWTGVQTHTNTITDTGAQSTFNFTLGNDANTDIISAIKVNATSAATGDADTIYGIDIANLTSADATVSEIALNVGTSWDTALAVGGTPIINGSGLLLSAGLSGTYSNALTLSSTSNALTGTIGQSTPLAGSFTTLTSTGVTTLGDGSATVAVNSSDWVISVTGNMTGIGNIVADGNIAFTPSGTSDITFNTAPGSGANLAITGLTTGTASTALCLDGSNNVITCTPAITINLQDAYDHDANGSDTVIALTANDDSLIFQNPASAGTDSTFLLKLDQLASGTQDVLTIAQAGTGNGLAITTSNAGTTPAAIKVSNSAGTITDAIDVSDATGITNAINVGANTIKGTTASLDFTNFDVNGTTGNITVAAGQGIDTNASGILALGNTTATTVNIGGTAATALNLGAGGALSRTIAIGTGTGADVINIGTGGTTADTITIGNSASSTSLALTSGTGAQTFTSSATSGNAFAFVANALTSGNGLNLSSTSTTLSSGKLGSFDWSPGSATTATGDLFNINIGTNGTTTGNLFSVSDTGSNLFSVSESGITANLPTSFTAAGDVSMAYDLQFTNQTASYIKSKAPLYLDVGESYESNDLTLRTYNSGKIMLDNVSGGYATLNFLGKSTTGDPSTCQPGDIYFNSTDATVRACTAANTWEALDNAPSAFTSFTAAGDSGSNQSITDGNTLSILGGTNGIDTVGSATDTLTLNLDTTEIAGTTFGSGSGFTWTFDAGTTDPTIAFADNAMTFTAGTNTFAGNVALGTNTLSGGAAAIDFTNFDVATTGNITVAAGVGLDTNGAGALALGNANATSVSLCNSANCDTLSLGTNADADTINIGDSTDTIGIAGTTTITGSTSINTSGTSGTSIGNSTGTLTFTGASSTTTLTTTGAATFSSSTASSDSIAILPQSSTATGSFTGTITSANLTGTRTWTFPDASGTVCVSGDTCASSGTLGYWSRTGTTISPSTSGDAITTSGNISTSATGTITSAGLLTGSAGLTISGGTANINVSGSSSTAIGNASGTFALLSNGGLNVTTGGALTGVASIDTISTSATSLGFAGTGTLSSGAGTALNITSGTSGAVTVDSGTTGNVNLGTGASAKTIAIGNNTGATALTLTSGTGAQTFTSSNVSGTTTASAFAFIDNALTTGTGSYLSSTSITQGKLLQLSSAANTLTSGTLLDVTTTSTGLTSGKLGSFDWSPGSASTATGDLFNINIGTNGTTTGNLFSISDTGSNLFTVSEAALTSALPASFTAAGDVSMAYDLQFTNQTSSFIKANGPLTIDNGESFESNNLTLRTYNSGNIIFDLGSTAGKVSFGSNITPVGLLTADNTNTATMGKAVAIFNQDESQDIITASNSGTTRFKINSAGNTFTTLRNTATFAVCHVTNGAGFDELTDCLTTVSADYMEMYPVDPGTTIGTILTTSSNFATTKDGDKVSRLIPSSAAYQENVIGVMSDKSKAGDFNSIGNNLFESDNPQPIALNGRVPVRMSPNSPAIASGDMIASSIDAGLGTKATHAGRVVGMALESWTPNSGKDNVMIYITNTWYDPDMALNSVGNVSIAQTIDGQQNTTYSLTGPNGLISRVGAFKDMVLASLRVGKVTSTEIATSTLTIDGKSVQQLIAEAVSNASGSGSLSTSGDATVSGQLVAATASISGDATVSGTLFADRIAALDPIKSALELNTASVSALAASFQNWSASASANVITADAIFANEYLNVQGTASITDAAINHSLIVGGSLALDHNSLTLISNTEDTLYIQATSSGKLDLLAGAMTLTTDGGLVVNTNAVFAKDVTVKGTLSTAILGIATESGKLSIATAGGEVASIDASGSATFAKLALTTQATSSAVVNLGATVGKATLKNGQTSVTIYTNQLSDKSLIYITPTSSTGNKVPFIQSKFSYDPQNPSINGSFTVAIDAAIANDITLNWWIIN